MGGVNSLIYPIFVCYLSHFYHFIMKKIITLIAAMTMACAIFAQDTKNWSDWQLYGTTSVPPMWRTYFTVGVGEYATPIQLPEDSKVTVHSRQNLDDETDMQLRINGMLNDNRDIILNLDRTTNQFISDTIATGSMVLVPDVNGETPLPEVTGLFKGNCYYNSGTIEFTLAFMYLSKSYGFDFTFSTPLQMDNIEPLTLLAQLDKEYIASTDEAKVNLSITCSDYVASCNVICYDDIKNTRDTIRVELPDETIMDGLARKTKTIPLDFSGIDASTRYYIAVIPFEADGVAAGLRKGTYCYINRAVNHTWKSLGKGQMTEILAHVGIVEDDEVYFDMENFQWTVGPSTSIVEVQEAEDLPGFYRIPDAFGDSHPLKKNLIPHPVEDDYSLYIDATDPDKVRIPASYVPFLVEGSPAYVSNLIDEYSDVAKLENNVLSFPANTVFVSNMHSSITAGDFDLQITLPEQTGIETVSADSATPEFFNLQGIRVNNPASGIFLKRVGSKTVKVRL